MRRQLGVSPRRRRLVQSSFVDFFLSQSFQLRHAWELGLADASLGKLLALKISFPYLDEVFTLISTGSEFSDESFD